MFTTFARPARYGAALALMVGVATPAEALQRGMPQYPIGVDMLYAADYPPVTGLFLFGYGLHYTIDNVRDGLGREIFNGFQGTVSGFALKPTYVWDTMFLGARPVTFLVQSFLYRDFSASTVNTFAPSPAPATVPFTAGHENFGLGDLNVSQNLNWKLDKGWSVNLGLDVWLPTGDYDKNRFFNVGSANAWTFMPGVAVTWRSPDNHHFSAKAQYAISTKNRQSGPDDFTATGLSLANYRSGQFLAMEGAVGYGVTKEIGLDLTGYAIIQTTPDAQNGADVANSKTQVFGIGPQLRYNIGGGAIAVRYQKEFDVKNAPQGDRFWVQAGIPLWMPK